jgi:hypothetical protein
MQFLQEFDVTIMFYSGLAILIVGCVVFGASNSKNNKKIGLLIAGIGATICITASLIFGIAWSSYST